MQQANFPHLYVCIWEQLQIAISLSKMLSFFWEENNFSFISISRETLADTPAQWEHNFRSSPEKKDEDFFMAFVFWENKKLGRTQRAHQHK